MPIARDASKSDHALSEVPVSKNEALMMVSAWLASRGRECEWHRSINPPGDRLVVIPKGPRLLILDSAFEDNNADNVVLAVQAILEEAQSDTKTLLLHANLTTEAK